MSRPVAAAATALCVATSDAADEDVEDANDSADDGVDHGADCVDNATQTVADTRHYCTHLGDLIVVVVCVGCLVGNVREKIRLSFFFSFFCLVVVMMVLFRLD